MGRFRFMVPVALQKPDLPLRNDEAGQEWRPAAWSGQDSIGRDNRVSLRKIDKLSSGPGQPRFNLPSF